MYKYAVSLLSALLILSAGCGAKPAPSDTSGPAEEERLTIAVIPKGTQHVFWKSIHAGAVKASRELDVDIIWKGPIREDDREAQIAEVENFISRNVSGIVLAPLDDKALRIPVTNAMRSDIPVVIVDSGLDSEDFVSFVATDNHMGGKIAGERMAEVLAGKGRVIMLRYLEGSASTNKRENGFMEVMGQHTDIEVVSSNQYAGASVESAQSASENLLARFLDADGNLEVEGIYCPNESAVFGMLRALENLGVAGSVTFVGFDASEQLVKGMKDGFIDSLVVQDPINMGYLGVKTMVAHLCDEKVETRIDTGVKLITAATMGTPENQSLLKPDLKQWLD